TTVSTPMSIAPRSMRKTLESRGLDVDFLAWLEGDDERVPRLDSVRKVRDADFVRAIRGAAWLEEWWSSPDAILPNKPDVWRARYEELIQFLFGAIYWSGTYHVVYALKDLEALERVIKTLHPAAWPRYLQDISHLRRVNAKQLAELKAMS